MRKLKGIVTSNKMQKTAVVRVDRLKKHPKYGKYYRVSGKFKAHDSKNECMVGDTVMIREMRPMSRDKRWEIMEIVKRASENDAGEAEQ